MSGRGGIYEGPDGSKLHGDGREVKAVNQTDRERVIAERGATLCLKLAESTGLPHDLQVKSILVIIKTEIQSIYDAGYIAAKEDAAKFMTDRGCSSWAAAIRKLEPKP